MTTPVWEAAALGNSPSRYANTLRRAGDFCDTWRFAHGKIRKISH
jgi:hypothetical protein